MNTMLNQIELRKIAPNGGTFVTKCEALTLEGADITNVTLLGDADNTLENLLSFLAFCYELPSWHLGFVFGKSCL